MNRWMEKENVVYIHKEILLSHKKEGSHDAIHNIMDPEDIRLSEISHIEKDKYHTISPVSRI